jgi:hypothetical protein
LGLVAAVGAGVFLGLGLVGAGGVTACVEDGGVVAVDAGLAVRVAVGALVGMAAAGGIAVAVSVAVAVGVAVGMDAAGVFVAVGA